MIHKYRCPVCGFPGCNDNPDGDNPYEFYGSYDICPACGTEYGADVYVDMPGGIKSGLERLRKEWVASGHEWFSTHRPVPSDWDWKENLTAIGVDWQKYPQ